MFPALRKELTFFVLLYAKLKNIFLEIITYAAAVPNAV